MHACASQQENRCLLHVHAKHSCAHVLRVVVGHWSADHPLINAWSTLPDAYALLRCENAFAAIDSHVRKVVLELYSS